MNSAGKYILMKKVVSTKRTHGYDLYLLIIVVILLMLVIGR